MRFPYPQSEVITTATFAAINGVVTETVRGWKRASKIQPAFETASGQSLYTRAELCFRLDLPSGPVVKPFGSPDRETHDDGLYANARSLLDSLTRLLRAEIPQGTGKV